MSRICGCGAQITTCSLLCPECSADLERMEHEERHAADIEDPGMELDEERFEDYDQMLTNAGMDEQSATLQDGTRVSRDDTLSKHKLDCPVRISQDLGSTCACRSSSAYRPTWSGDDRILGSTI